MKVASVAALAVVAACAGSDKSTSVPVAPRVPIDLRVPQSQPEIENLMPMSEIWRHEISRSSLKVRLEGLSGAGNVDDVLGAPALGTPRNPFLMVEEIDGGRRLVERRPSSKAKKAMDEADKAFSGGKLDEALEGYKKVIESDPLWAKPFFYVAAVLKKRRDFDGADQWVERGLRLAPRDGFGYALRAEMAAERGDMNRARETLARALALDPFSPPAMALVEKLGGKRVPFSPAVEIRRSGRDLVVGARHPAWHMWGVCRGMLLFDARARAEYLQGLAPGSLSPMEDTTCGFLAVAAYRESRVAGGAADADLDRWSSAFDAGLLREALIYDGIGSRRPEILQLLPDDVLRMVEYARIFVVPK